MKFNGTIDKDGNIKIASRKILEKWFSDRKNKRFTLEVKAVRKRRSLPQNAYYWSVIIPLMHEAFRDLGHDVDEQGTHEILKAKFNSTTIKNKDGVETEIAGSTTSLSTLEAMEYYERIARFAAEFLNVVIPEPNQQTTIDNYLKAG